MMPSRIELERWDREKVWHAFTQMREYSPFIIERARGCTLVDLSGNEYLDGVSSLWCNVHGHGHPRLDAAIRDQLDRVAHVTSLGMSNPTTIELAHRLTELTGLDHVFFSSDGSSAVEVALKMAFQYWQQRDDPRPGKTRYVAFGDAYHGDTLGSVSVGGVARFHAMFQPLLFDVIRLEAPVTFPLPEGVAADAACQHYLGRLEQLLADRHEEIAAVVIEPRIQCAAGMRTHPDGFLRGLRELTDRFDVFLIADEVAVGFGRTGQLFACETEQVLPDFLCLGKGITGGYLPLSATLTRSKIWNAFLGSHEESKTFFHGHTYGGNPLAAAVALASLELFQQEEVLRNLEPKIAFLKNWLHRIKDHPHVADTRQVGMIAGVELVEDKVAGRPFPGSARYGQQVCEAALRHGVWLRPLGDILVIMPPLAIEQTQLRRICEAAERGIAEVTGVAVTGGET